MNDHKRPAFFGKFLIFLTILLSGFVHLSYSQQKPGASLSNLRQKWFTIHSDTIQIDTFSIIPNTIRIAGVPDSMFISDHINGIIIWKHRPVFDSVLVRYRVFDKRLNAVARRMEYDSVMNRFLGKPFIPDYGTGQDDRFFNFGNITYNGSFGRGISFGNSQDAVVTSNLNLQLNGFLADSIELVAAITDNNIPIQPDGTTQQLNEFDRIFLQFKKKGWELSLGDIDIRQNESYFLTFYKRLQGIAFQTISPIGKKSTNKTLLSGSIAKGKFTRNIFQGQEGNQGPYRLKGSNNEFFFVVLANTERVYIDGELLQRGEDQDYVINYNTAEIAFTPRRMITKDSRIQVEFEYSDRNYLNANLYAFNETNINNKLKLRISAFNNSDSKSSPINQTLDGNQKTFLDSIGNDINRAFYPNAVLDTFLPGKILYKKVDTLVNGSFPDSIYIFSTNPDSARYSLSFIDVGAGNGNYIPEFNGANGKVFRWVAPVNGQKQGNFEPAVFLVTPKKQQIVSVGADYAVTKNTQVLTELAMSNYDVNTFSSKDNNNNKGYAGKLLVKDSRKLGIASAGRILTTDVGYEFVEEKFRPIERLRNVEYTRDWGLPIVTQPADEKILTAGIQISDNKANLIRYQFTNFQRSDIFNGFRNTITHVQNMKEWKLNNIISLSNTDSDTEDGYFLRPSFSVARKFEKLKNYSIAVNYSVEHNEIKNKLTDSVSPQSFSFAIFQAALKSDEGKANKWGLTYYTRTDAYPYGGKLSRSDRSQNVNVFTELLKSERHQFRLNSTYRVLKILDHGISTLKPDESILSRAEYTVNEWRGFVTGNVLYEIGAGQEQKRDFAFLEVPAGQGEYTWIDYNTDGIQSLNEFEIALFQDQAKYIRIFTPTNEFIKANYNTFNYSFSLNPRAIIDMAKAKKLPKFLSRISLQSGLQINKKEIAKGIVQFNPFASPLNDTSLITLTSIFVNTFSFNRFSSKWGFDINNSRNAGKSLLTYGYESRKLDDWSIKGRINVSRQLLFDITVRTGVNELTSSNIKFGNRNYMIRQQSLEPRATFTKGSVFRWQTSYRFGDKQNTIGSKERAASHAVNTEIKYNILQSTSLLGKFTYNNINFTSVDSLPNHNTTASYILLDGLSPGRNFLWTLDLTRRLSNSLEMNIQYEGRKPGTGRIVHVGRAGIRAML